MKNNNSTTSDKILRIFQYPHMFFKYFVLYPYAPLLAQLVVTRRCNLKCGYCEEFDNISDPVPLDRLIKSISKLSEIHLHSLTLTGGEPTLHPEILEIIRFSVKLIPKVSMITNGFTLNKNLIEELNKSGLGRMQISIDGIKPSDITKKVFNNLEEKLILLSKYAKFKVHINSVLGSIPYDETREIIQRAKKMGFETTVQWLHGEKGNVLNPHNISAEQIHQLIKDCNFPIYHSKSIIKIGIETDKPWKCRAGSRFLYINEISKVIFCSQTEHLWSVDIDELNEEMLKINFYTKKPCGVGCTLGCVRDNSKYDSFRKQ